MQLTARAYRRGACELRSMPQRMAPMDRPADLEEVMHFDPEEGIANLDEHLDRLDRLADEQGFSFDRHAARNELQAATFGKRRPATARLLLSPTGAMAIEVKPA